MANKETIDRIARMILEPAPPHKVNSGYILPLSDYSDGTTRFDADAGILAPFSAFNRMLERGADAPVEEQIPDATLAAAAAVMPNLMGGTGRLRPQPELPTDFDSYRTFPSPRPESVGVPYVFQKPREPYYPDMPENPAHGIATPHGEGFPRLHPREHSADFYSDLYSLDSYRAPDHVIGIRKDKYGWRDKSGRYVKHETGLTAEKMQFPTERSQEAIFIEAMRRRGKSLTGQNTPGK